MLSPFEADKTLLSHRHRPTINPVAFYQNKSHVFTWHQPTHTHTWAACDRSSNEKQRIRVQIRWTQLENWITHTLNSSSSNNNKMITEKHFNGNAAKTNNSALFFSLSRFNSNPIFRFFFSFILLLLCFFGTFFHSFIHLLIRSVVDLLSVWFGWFFLRFIYAHTLIYSGIMCHQWRTILLLFRWKFYFYFIFTTQGRTWFLWLLLLFLFFSFHFICIRCSWRYQTHTRRSVRL